MHAASEIEPAPMDERATRPRDARISYGLAAVCLIAGILLVGFAAYSMSPGACGNENGCTGGRDATPLTGIAVGGGLIGVAYAAWKKGRTLSRDASTL